MAKTTRELRLEEILRILMHHADTLPDKCIDMIFALIINMRIDDINKYD